MPLHQKPETLDWVGTHITFTAQPPESNRKTTVWLVDNGYGDGFLGHVKWFSRWRKYCFFPAPDCVFEGTCMRELSDFIEARTGDHRIALGVQTIIADVLKENE